MFLGMFQPCIRKSMLAMVRPLQVAVQEPRSLIGNGIDRHEIHVLVSLHPTGVLLDPGLVGCCSGRTGKLGHLPLRLPARHLCSPAWLPAVHRQNSRHCSLASKEQQLAAACQAAGYAWACRT